ncbi:MAG TPA: hypothetical protein VIU93_07670 [Gallionellaceae bacterium]
MNGKLIMGLMVISLHLAGCDLIFREHAFLNLDTAGSLPDPVIRLESRLTVSEFHIYKHTPTDDVNHVTEYWGAVAKSVDGERYLGEIRYGRLPDGYHETVAPRALDEGDYYVRVDAHVHVIAGGQFYVERAKDGKLIIVNPTSGGR